MPRDAHPSTPQLTDIVWKAGKAPAAAGFPFDVPSIHALRTLKFRKPVTFFVGENGTGKSTLLEAIAIAAHLPTVGARDLARDDTLSAQRSLAAQLKLGWGKRTHRGFFLRAEDFFGFVQRLSAEREELLGQRRAFAAEFAQMDRSPDALGRAQGPLNASLEEMERRYGQDLDANSHGQSFWRLFRSRFVPQGLYLLDEPESALSPQSQLAFIAMLIDQTRLGAQFIVATHSPIILGCPNAEILSFDDGAPKRVAYDALPHVTLTRDFLNHRQRFLKYLE